MTDHPVPDLGIDLSNDAAEKLQAVGGLQEPPDTFADWMSAVADKLAAGTSLVVEDMYLDEPSRHEVHLADRVEHVPCVQDALIAAVLADAEPVTVRSESPTGGEVVELRVADGTVDASPPDAVMSFGLSTHTPAPGAADEPPVSWLGEADSPLRALGCDYINAFPSPAAYEAWAAEQERVVTLELTFEQGHALARAAADLLFE